MESVDSIVIIGGTSNFLTLSITGIGLIIIPISAGIACTLSLGNKVFHKLIISKYNKYKKQYEKDQQTVKSFDKLYRKSLQDNVIDHTNMNFYVIFLLYIWMELKTNLFYKLEYKKNLSIFSHTKLQFEQRT